MSEPSASEPLRRLLAELPGRVPVWRMDSVWVFAPRDLGGRESGLLVLSLLPPDAPTSSQRQLVTISYEAVRVGGAVRRTDTVTEQGWAPAGRIPALIAGVLKRLGESHEEEPVTEQIGGDADRWSALLDRLGIRAG